jgi:lipoyl-dependent peroxiredoxin
LEVLQMAAVSRADANWKGDLIHGGGGVRPASGAFAELPVTWATRAERSEAATSPEELLAAAHAACFCMAFSNGLAKAGHEDIRLTASSEVEFVPGTGVTTATITVRGGAKGISGDEFVKLATEAKDGCPISQALKGNVELRLDAALG